MERLGRKVFQDFISSEIEGDHHHPSGLGDVIGFPLTHEVYHMERTGEGILRMMTTTTRTTRKKLIDAFDLKLLRVTNQRVFGS